MGGSVGILSLEAMSAEAIDWSAMANPRIAQDQLVYT